MAEPSKFQSLLGELTATIANGATTSGAIDLGGGALVGIRTPATLTGTSFAVQAADEAGNFLAVYDSSGNAVAITAAADRHIYLNPANFAGLRQIKLVSNASEGGDRTITLIVRPV